MKEKDYTITVDVHVHKGTAPNSKRWYSIKMFGHPIIETEEPFSIEISNMREEQALRVGKELLNAIWQLAEERDGEYWSE